MTTTNQKKNTTIPGMAYPATVLALATAPSYPASPDLSATGAAALTGGFHWALWVCGLTGLAAIPVAFALIRRTRKASPRLSGEGHLHHVGSNELEPSAR